MTDDLSALIDAVKTAEESPDTEREEEQVSNTQKEQPEKSQIPGWIIPLQSVDKDGLVFSEFNESEYAFKQLSDPDGVDTGKFSVFYRNKTGKDKSWITLPGLLSGIYTVAHVEKFYKELSKQLNIPSSPRIHTSPFSISCRATTRHDIDMFKDESMKLAVELVSGIDIDTMMSNISSAVDVCVINTYNGTSSIHMDYIIKTTSKTSHVFTDYFILSNHSHVFNHTTNKLGAINADITNVQNYFDSTINILKSMTANVDKLIEDVGTKMKKSARNQMNSYWENLPPEQRTLLFALVIISHCLDCNYDAKQHIQIRSYISHILAKIVTSKN